MHAIQLQLIGSETQHAPGDTINKDIDMHHMVVIEPFFAQLIKHYLESVDTNLCFGKV